MKTSLKQGVFLLFIILIAFRALSQDLPSSWLEGYTGDVKGEVFTYHSPHPEATTSLLVRNIDSTRYIEWTIESLPHTSPGKIVTYVWMYGIDVNEKKFAYKVYLDDKYILTFTNPQDTLLKTWIVKGNNNISLTFRSTLVDKYGDLMGYAFMEIPSGLIKTDRPVKLRVVGETAGDRSWYMTFRYKLQSKASVKQEPALIRGIEGPEYLIRFDIHHFGTPAQATIIAGDKKIIKKILIGLNQEYVPISIDLEKIEATVVVNGDTVSNQCVLLEPVKQMNLYLLHHTHTDIGYTHVQTEVEEMHRSFIEQAIDLARKTRGYPEGARFKWNTEVMWGADCFLAHADTIQRKEFIEAVHKGWIELDGLYANELTGLCNQEELIRLTEAGRRIARMSGIPLEAAMISDIPGYTWSLVTTLAQSGIKYFSIGPNTGHRIGSFLETWADKPFYWESPDGKNRILCWVAGKGYSWYHTGLGFTKIRNKLNEKNIFEYVSQLESSGFPYDMSIFRYNIGSDNGPPDPYIADVVKEWNERYISPRIIISTVSESFKIFEDKYGAQLSVYRGDWTPFWEDGAASSARETALNRQASERLVQAQTLWAMRDPHHYPSGIFAEAWKNILLFDEHTWGSWNSISEPENPFTLQQWAIKQEFAKKADSLSKILAQVITTEEESEYDPGDAFDILNTCSWSRSDIILLSPEQSKAGDIAKDESGMVWPSQRLSTNELAVAIENVPPLGAMRLFISSGSQVIWGKTMTNTRQLSNDKIILDIDTNTGSISSLLLKNKDYNLVDINAGQGLNQYLYITGRNPGNPLTVNRSSIHINEDGGLVKSIITESVAPGCNKISSEIMIYEGSDRVDIINTIDKKKIFDPEGVFFGFPFHIPDGLVTINLSIGNYSPGEGQIPGSCMNYYTAGRWVDVSNADMGVTFITTDAPLIELGRITTDATSTGWIREYQPTQMIFSYVMNNYWETNYLASQEGIAVCRYTLIPHQKFDPSQAEKWATELSQPLVILPANRDLPLQKSLLELSNNKVIINSIKPSDDNEAIMIRLYNTSEEEQEVEIMWGALKPQNIYMSNFDEERKGLTGSKFRLNPYEIISLRVE
ncbi:MAG: glycosyl hydrolase-related protein [Bacteroidetes bacterium]|nr:glycosyl hydrolase-related protein [Bacteroidota bacterium]